MYTEKPFNGGVITVKYPKISERAQDSSYTQKNASNDRYHIHNNNHETIEEVITDFLKRFEKTHFMED